jgi:hypothetical protein
MYTNFHWTKRWPINPITTSSPERLRFLISLQGSRLQRKPPIQATLTPTECPGSSPLTFVLSPRLPTFAFESVALKCEGNSMLAPLLSTLLSCVSHRNVRQLWCLGEDMSLLCQFSDSTDLPTSIVDDWVSYSKSCIHGIPGSHTMVHYTVARFCPVTQLCHTFLGRIEVFWVSDTQSTGQWI